MVCKHVKNPAQDQGVVRVFHQRLYRRNVLQPVQASLLGVSGLGLPVLRVRFDGEIVLFGKAAVAEAGHGHGVAPSRALLRHELLHGVRNSFLFRRQQLQQLPQGFLRQLILLILCQAALADPVSQGVRQLNGRRPDAAAQQMPQGLLALGQAIQAHQLRRCQCSGHRCAVRVGQLHLVCLGVPLPGHDILDEVSAEVQDDLHVKGQLVPSVLQPLEYGLAALAEALEGIPRQRVVPQGELLHALRLVLVLPQAVHRFNGVLRRIRHIGKSPVHEHLVHFGHAAAHDRQDHVQLLQVIQVHFPHNVRFQGVLLHGQLYPVHMHAQHALKSRRKVQIPLEQVCPLSRIVEQLLCRQGVLQALHRLAVPLVRPGLAPALSCGVGVEVQRLQQLPDGLLQRLRDVLLVGVGVHVLQQAFGVALHLPPGHVQHFLLLPRLPEFSPGPAVRLPLHNTPGFFQQRLYLRHGLELIGLRLQPLDLALLGLGAVSILGQVKLLLPGQLLHLPAGQQDLSLLLQGFQLRVGLVQLQQLPPEQVKPVQVLHAPSLAPVPLGHVRRHAQHVPV